VSLGATLTVALLGALERPATWALSLVAFLVRGGWLIVLAPVVALPTAVGAANVIAPLLEDVAFGRRTAEVLTLGLGVLAAGLVWLVGGGILAAATEVEAVRRVADVIAPESQPSPTRRYVAWRVLTVRLLALMPLLLALGWAAIRLVGVGYRELTAPTDVATPAAWRIVGGAPDAVLAVVATWLFAETVGAMAARRVILSADSMRDAIRRAVSRLVHAPVRPIAIAVTSGAVLLAVLGTTGFATSVTWSGLRGALAAGDPSLEAWVALVLFVGMFAGSLVLIGLTSAWRMAIWTVDAATRVREGADRTFGGVTATRSGD
jgi:hypothetical protein